MAQSTADSWNIERFKASTTAHARDLSMLLDQFEHLLFSELFGIHTGAYFYGADGYSLFLSLRYAPGCAAIDQLQ